MEVAMETEKTPTPPTAIYLCHMNRTSPYLYVNNLSLHINYETYKWTNAEVSNLNKLRHWWVFYVGAEGSDVVHEPGVGAHRHQHLIYGDALQPRHLRCHVQSKARVGIPSAVAFRLQWQQQNFHTKQNFNFIIKKIKNKIKNINIFKILKNKNSKIIFFKLKIFKIRFPKEVSIATISRKLLQSSTFESYAPYRKNFNQI